jgi:hypothetical protein
MFFEPEVNLLGTINGRRDVLLVTVNIIKGPDPLFDVEGMPSMEHELIGITKEFELPFLRVYAKVNRAVSARKSRLLLPEEIVDLPKGSVPIGFPFL